MTTQVLYVGNDDAFRKVVHDYLLKEGFTVQVADAPQAEAALKEHHQAIGAVLLDCETPGLDADATVKSLRGRTSPVRVVLMGGSMKASGVVALTEPLANLHKVAEALRKVCEGGRAVASVII